jgi:hypothetical protein
MVLRTAGSRSAVMRGRARRAHSPVSCGGRLVATASGQVAVRRRSASTGDLNLGCRGRCRHPLIVVAPTGGWLRDRSGSPAGPAPPRAELCGIPSTWQRSTTRRSRAQPRCHRQPTRIALRPGLSRGGPSGGRGDATPTRPPRHRAIRRRSSPRPACPARAISCCRTIPTLQMWISGAYRRTLFRTRVWRPALVRSGLLGVVEPDGDKFRGEWTDAAGVPGSAMF